MADHAAAAQARRRNFAAMAWNEYDHGSDEEDDGHEEDLTMDNAIGGFVPPPLQSISLQITPTFIPLLQAICNQTRRFDSRAVFADVDKEVHDNQSLNASKYFNTQQWLEDARRCKMPIAYTYHSGRKEVEYAWFALRRESLGLEPSVDDDEPPPLRGDTALMYDGYNLTEKIVREVVKITSAVDAPFTAERLARRLRFADTVLLSRVIPLLQRRGVNLAWYKNEAGGEMVSVIRADKNVESRRLCDAFCRIMEREDLRISTTLLEESLWKLEPNVFLDARTLSIDALIEYARTERGVPVHPQTGSNRVVWLG